MDYYYSNKETISQTKSSADLKIKVCGMNKNTVDIASLKPDYLGFIFWEASKRNFEGDMPHLPHSVKKVGVFVNASLDFVEEQVKKFNLLLVQLHGEESADYCKKLKKKIPHIKIIKVFSIRGDFDFGQLEVFEDVSDFYLFDTKGELPGGNGYTFDWEVLQHYPSTKPYFLSGGIGLEELKSIQEFLKRPEAKYCFAVDVNSKFEIEPGLKDVKKITEFIQSLSNESLNK